MRLLTSARRWTGRNACRHWLLLALLVLPLAAQSFRATIVGLPNFQAPVFQLDRSNVGQVTLTANEGREFQFAVKIIF